jgi:hypothetical protein
MGIVVRFAPLPRLAGAYVSEPGSRPGILVNTRHPRSKQRYTLAHELGHHVLGHVTSLDTDTELWPDEGMPDEERLAESFASWLLMPRSLVNRCCERLAIASPPDEGDVYRLSLCLGASYRATVRHLANLRSLDAGNADRLASVRPQQIKTRLAGDGVGVGAADVHVVGRREAEVEIMVAAGDIVVVTGNGSDEPKVTTIGPLSSVDRVTLFPDGRAILRVLDAGPQNPSEPPLAGEIQVDDGEGGFRVHLAIEPHRYGIAERWFPPLQDQK